MCDVAWFTQVRKKSMRVNTQMLHGAGIFTYIYPKNDPNVGKYSIHGASGICYLLFFSTKDSFSIMLIFIFALMLFEIAFYLLASHSNNKIWLIDWSMKSSTMIDGMFLNELPSGYSTYSHGKLPIYRWFTYEKWWFSMAMLHNQMVYTTGW